MYVHIFRQETSKVSKEQSLILFGYFRKPVYREIFVHLLPIEKNPFLKSFHLKIHWSSLHIFNVFFIKFQILLIFFIGMELKAPYSKLSKCWDPFPIPATENQQFSLLFPMRALQVSPSVNKGDEIHFSLWNRRKSSVLLSLSINTYFLFNGRLMDLVR